ncbi:hypothetical protein [Altibacter sp.]|uniref:hypothetical protein n=1 Tax=Altibacter sp. TaxID=2024823 RepID=UPI0025C39CCA|nr:hypothetical protein [Altibacter sp.]|tara:strand:- start:305 stop:949 length:645 start_codon:yes stop_codon:yes gene_type:complete
MKLFLSSLCLLAGVLATAQIENPTGTVQFEASETTSNDDPSGFELPAVKTPSLSNPDTPSKYDYLGDTKEEKLDITKGDGLLEYKTDTAPKYFTKDKAVTKEIGGDQHLGDVRTKSGIVSILYRDHEYVDGDNIRVFVNEDIVQSNVMMSGSFGGIHITLESGFNRIEFLALNQGTSGPNTAELHVYDEHGKLISAKEWNLLTGDKATIVIVKE